jgi:hypothetical protein
MQLGGSGSVPNAMEISIGIEDHTQAYFSRTLMTSTASKLRSLDCVKGFVASISTRQ